MPHMAPMSWLMPILLLSFVMYFLMILLHFALSGQASSHFMRQPKKKGWPWKSN